MLGIVGPLFAPVNPQNAQSTGFSAGNFGTGAVGTISGIPVYVSNAITAGNGLIMSLRRGRGVRGPHRRPAGRRAVSVLGVQVAYAGHFAVLALENAAIIKITAA